MITLGLKESQFFLFEEMNDYNSYTSLQNFEQVLFHLSELPVLKDDCGKYSSSM